MNNAKYEVKAVDGGFAIAQISGNPIEEHKKFLSHTYKHKHVAVERAKAISA